MKRRIGAFLLALSLALWLLPAAALASESGTPGETQEETGGETGNEGGTDSALSDGTSVVSADPVTRAQLAEIIYANELLKTNIDLAGAGNESMTLPFTDLEVEGEDVDCTEVQRAAIIALYKAQYISGTGETTFSPGGQVTRGEALVILWRVTGCRSNTTALAEDYFGDEKLDQWYVPALNCFYGAGLVKGSAPAEGGKPIFGGSEPFSVRQAHSFVSLFVDGNTQYEAFLANSTEGAVTRVVMAVEFYNRFYQELSNIAPTRTGAMPFTDLAGCTDEQIQAIRFFYERNIISGTGDTTFTPYGPVSNLQLAMLLQRCATATEAPAEGEVQATSLLRAAPLSGTEDALNEAFQFLIDNGADPASVQAAGSNQDAPGLAKDLEAWSDGLTPKQPTIAISGSTVTITPAAGYEDTPIYCTTDGSDPSSAAGTKYEGPITLTASATVKAAAVKNNLVSPVAQAVYTAPVLTITPSAASLSGGGTVTLTVANLPAGVTAENVSVTCDVDGIVPAKNDDGTWTVTLPNADAQYTFTVTAGDATEQCTVSVSRYVSGGSSGGGSSTTTETVKNPDGSTTTTVTNKATGTVTETTRDPDGSATVVETRRDGSVTTSVDRADGASSRTCVDAEGRTEAEVTLPADVIQAAGGGAILLPMPAVSAAASRADAPTVTVDLSGREGIRVEIPVEDPAPGTVAVLVGADGTETVIRTSLTTETGVTVALSDGDTVKLVDNTKTFSDVPAGHWAAEEVAFAASRELFQGTGGGTFAPEAAMSRAMILTVLARLEGVDTSAGDTWYSAGLQWAVEAGISDGSAPEQGLTREQLALILYRYAGQPAAESGLGGFADGSSVSDWAAQGMAWAVEEGLISGVGGNTLSPQGAATRAQVAAILARFFQLL